MGEMNEIERWYAFGDARGDGPWNDVGAGGAEAVGSADVASVVGRCVNCDSALARADAASGRFVCSQQCREAAKLVRYWRASIASGRIEDADVLDAIEIKMAMVLGGGYPEEARRLSAELRAAVLDRDGGLCQTCGKPGSEIDHIRDGSAEINNLQTLCHACHVKKTKGTFGTANAEQMAMARAIEGRAFASVPQRLCDDHERWDGMWREVQAANRRWARGEDE